MSMNLIYCSWAFLTGLLGAELQLGLPMNI
jgi:hypothetical protein